MSKQRIGFYPGTFDPITLGHSDIIQRATRLVDKLVIGVAINRDKGPMFNLDERVEMVQDELDSFPGQLNDCEIELRPFDNLLMHCAQEHGAGIIIRGLRAVSDFEYEFQMVGMNLRLNSEIETVFLMANDKYQFIASRLVKEITRLDGDVSAFVSPRVTERLYKRVGRG
ncbi:MAG: pantetheine-phosphate adenylyltransferase [Alphaproteobacteria bacterium]|nr:pantetheine-phosphate adenylyltransferase [Rhodospirillaceae bacterium]MDP6021219.1 pantetheine-phosphate adenylyltransferase [Alphaproteobacteria bacterium]MDP6254611.1 pantetheine-phosphate adenylyltransferase [Alphaproteobacteria bacterium]MDP7053624.1 pantetheine-phosphate adenylyltransferase [Alphaproteobacteria bacterium]MDP7228783.1 pantetheine-phosphate adenylyltransferase [Alphaproteobacteria bacterium]